ncbi:MAG: LLM class flavin-dependent oxidoreductase [Acidimicrobiia bacterium]|nr:LLM class flavin-dependent oxidoreductase [Acidimicrobiia bacterium]
MRLGISLRSAHAVDDARVGARWMVERAVVAREAGLDSLFVGDHHAVPVPYYQNTAILGRLLAEWGDRPAGALYLLPLWHPVLVAEQVGTLAAIARGRFVMQCAVGAGAGQFGALGVAPADRASRMEAALDVIRRLLRGQEVTSDGPWRIGPTRIAPLPPEPVEVWVGGHAPPAVDRAARLGDGWLAGPELLPAEARDLLEAYRERCHVHGRTPSAIAIRRDVHVGADPADARRVAERVLERGYRGFRPGVCVVGGVEEVAGELRDLGSMGYTDVIVRHLADDQGEALASIARLREVRAALIDA